MIKNKRNGNRVTRAQRTNRRKPELGYYLVITDTTGTEKNYINGFRDSIREELSNKIVIKVSETSTKNLIKEAMDFASELPQYAEPWIIFDRDKVPNFDKIISSAKASGIGVGWSNPCFEIWLSAYFNTMLTYSDSTSCCSAFSKKYEGVTGMEYDKADKRIYNIITKYGNEDVAINIAKKRLKDQQDKGYQNPSEMLSTTTVHLLIDEIKNKI